MNNTSYKKPNMTNMPADLGVRIFKAILNTPPLDQLLMRRQSDELKRRMMEELEKHKND